MIVLYAFGPLQITYAQEARPYGLLMFFVAIAVLGFVLLLSPYRAAAGDGNAATPPRDTENSTAALAIATIGTAGAGLSIVGGWIVALAFQASLAIQPAATRRSLLRPWLVNVAITWVAILPFAVGIWRSLDKASASSWVETIRPLNVQTMLSMADGLFLRPGPSMAGLLAVAHAGANVALIGLAIVAVIAGRHRPAVRFLGFATLALPLLLLATSSVQSVLVERYFLPCIATFLLLSSLGVALAWPRRWMRIVIALLAVATALQGVRTVVRSERADYRPLASFLERNNVGGIAVISRIRHLKLELGHYLKSPLSLEVRTANALASDEIRKSLGANQGLWLLYRKSEAPVLDGAIPPEVVRCDWQYLDGRIEWRLILLASTRSDLPPRLRQCEPNNGAIPFPAGSGAMRGPPHG
jgi:hypothetical protein